MSVEIPAPSGQPMLDSNHTEPAAWLPRCGGPAMKRPLWSTSTATRCRVKLRSCPAWILGVQLPTLMPSSTHVSEFRSVISGESVVGCGDPQGREAVLSERRKMTHEEPAVVPPGGDADVVGERRRLVSLAYRMTGTLADAEDVVQEKAPTILRPLLRIRERIRSTCTVGCSRLVPPVPMPAPASPSPKSRVRAGKGAGFDASSRDESAPRMHCST